MQTCARVLLSDDDIVTFSKRYAMHESRVVLNKAVRAPCEPLL